MRCPSCNSENPVTAKFCIECGAALKCHCSKCGFDNLPQAKFCSECGASFIESVGKAVTEPSTNAGMSGAGARQSTGNGQRRHLTVMFCDVVSSTTLAAQLDPEERRELIADYHRTASQAVERFGGHVAQYLGDGVLAYFGWPEAHDNDAERGARGPGDPRLSGKAQ